MGVWAARAFRHEVVTDRIRHPNVVILLVEIFTFVGVASLPDATPSVAITLPIVFVALAATANLRYCGLAFLFIDLHHGQSRLVERSALRVVLHETRSRCKVEMHGLRLYLSRIPRGCGVGLGRRAPPREQSSPACRGGPRGYAFESEIRY